MAAHVFQCANCDDYREGAGYWPSDAPRDTYGRIDPIYRDSGPARYCSEACRATHEAAAAPKAAVELEVILFDAGRRLASAEPDSIDDAAFVGQTLWDDADRELGLSRKSEVGFYVNGKLALMFAGRPSPEIGALRRILNRAVS